MVAKYENIGNTLRAAREEFRLSTHDVSEALHIRAIYLEALEEGRFENLPGAAYARGYLRRYASFLELDPQEILRRFEQVEVGLRRGFFLPQGVNREKRPSQTMVYGGLAAVFIIFGLWLLFQPSRGGFSVVDNPVKKPRFAQNASCFQPQDGYYPACYRTEAAFTWWPLKGQVDSVMDLAITEPALKKNKSRR